MTNHVRGTRSSADPRTSVAGRAYQRLRSVAVSLVPKGVQPWMRSEYRELQRRTGNWIRSRGRTPPVCESVEQWAFDHPGTVCIPLYPLEQVERNMPQTVEAEIHPAYPNRRVHILRAKYLVEIHDGRILSRSGLVVLPDGQFALEAIFRRDMLELHKEFFTYLRTPPPCVRKPGRYYSLLVLWSKDGDNYYHWLHDTLQRLFRVTEHLAPDTLFIVPANLNPVRRETLRLLGIDDERTVEFTGDEMWELETLYFAPATAQSGNHRRAAELWLRDALMGPLGIPVGPADRRIFVSRSRAPQRKLVNEDEVVRYLADYGFETVVSEDMTFAEQVALFARAEVVVATHGAGLTNMIFAPEGLKVVEMIEPGMMGAAHIYWSMAEELGHEHWYFEGVPVPVPGLQNDMVVPMEKLTATIEQMGLSRSR